MKSSWYHKIWINFPLIIAVTGILAMIFMSVHSITSAWLGGNWNWIHRYNDYGEGYVELFFTWLSVPFILFYVFSWSVKELKEK